MNQLDNFISKTLKPALIIFGLATCMPLLFAVSIDFLPVFANGIELTQSGIPAHRHWGFMVFGIGALLFASAFYPWLRFSTMVYSTLEKAFMVYLWISSMNEPWGDAYSIMGILDTVICIYSVLYFISSYGRPSKWIKV